MNFNLAFSAQVERALRDRAAAAGKDVSTIIAEIVTENLVDASSAAPPREHGEVIDRLRAFARLHPQIDTLLDDRRESIYEDRGE